MWLGRVGSGKYSMVGYGAVRYGKVRSGAVGYGEDSMAHNNKSTHTQLLY